MFDPLTYEETTGAALELVNRHLGKFPVKAVVYSHSQRRPLGRRARRRRRGG
ncbi:MAG: hypothetical protein ABFS45_13360 [Pseudomonadota bacterium]